MPPSPSEKNVNEAIKVQRPSDSPTESGPCVKTMLCGNEHGESRDQLAIARQVECPIPLCVVRDSVVAKIDLAIIEIDVDP